MSRALGFVTNVILVRLLGVHHYGIYVFIMSWFGLLTVISMFGLRQVLIREVSKYYEQKQWGLIRGILVWSTQQTFLFSIGCAVVFGIFVWLIRYQLDSSIFPAAWIALAALPISVESGILASVMQGLRYVTLSKAPTILIQGPFFLLLLLVFGIVMSLNIDSAAALGLTLVSLVVTLAVILWLLFRILPDQVKISESHYESDNWRKSGLTMLMADGIAELNVRVPLILIGLLAAVEVTGIFNVAQLLTGIAGLILLSINAALSPIISSIYASGDIDRLQRLVTRATRLMFVCTMLMAILILLTRDWLLQFFGEGFVGVGPVLSLLIIGQLINTAAGPVGQLLLMTGYERDVTRTMLNSTVLLIALLIFLIPVFDAVGAGVASLISTVYWNIALSLLTLKRLGIDGTILGLSVQQLRQQMPDGD